MLTTLSWLPFVLRLQSKLLKRPLKSLENLKWASFHITHGISLPQKYNVPSYLFWTFAHASPFAWTPLFHTPGFYLVHSSQCKCSFFFRGRFSYALRLGYTFLLHTFKNSCDLGLLYMTAVPSWRVCFLCYTTGQRVSCICLVPGPVLGTL